MRLVCAALLTLAATAMGQAPAAKSDCPTCPDHAKAGVSTTSAAGQALPAGHPPVAGQPTSRPAMPPGHPPMGGMGGMPPGHSPVGGMPAMPAGHPDMRSRMPTSMPAANGKVTIRAVQSTKGGPAIGAETVIVDLLHRGQSIKRVETKLDEKGTAVIEGLPMMPPAQPVAYVIHGGIAYEAVGTLMNSQQAQQELKVEVYETTETAPQWKVPMRHVMVRAGEGGNLTVTEMIVVENTSDRTWIGAAQADGKRTTLTLPFTTEATDLQPQDLFTRAEGKLVGSLPVLPGTSQFQFQYVVPMKDGKAKLSIQAPTDVKQMILFVPEEKLKTTVDGLALAGAHDMGRGKMQMFKGADLKAGSQVTVTVEPAPAKAAAAGPVGAGKSAMPKIVAGVGGGLVLAVGAGLIFAKGAKRGETKTE